MSEQFHYYKPSEAGEDSMPMELDAAMQALDEAKAQVEQLSAELEGKRSLVYSLEESLEAERAQRLAAQQEAEELQATMVSPEEVSKLCGEVEREKVKVKEIWSLSCEQLRRMDDEYGKCVEESVKKDREISKLHRRISELENQVRGVSMPMVHCMLIPCCHLNLQVTACLLVCQCQCHHLMCQVTFSMVCLQCMLMCRRLLVY